MPKLTKSRLSKIAPEKHPKTLIRAYGEFWIRDEVDWKGKRLMGQRRHFRGTTKERVFDAWYQKGIYALHKDFKIVYVGQADDRGLGQRLSEHCRDRLRRRWDTFSWYGVCQISHDGKQTPYKAVSLGQSTLIRTLELIGILMSDAPLNRAQGRFEGAEKIDQRGDKKETPDIQESLQEILNQLHTLKKQ